MTQRFQIRRNVTIRGIEQFKFKLDDESIIPIDQNIVARSEAAYFKHTSKWLLNLITMNSSVISHLILSLGSGFSYSHSTYPLLTIRTEDLIKSQTEVTDGSPLFSKDSRSSWELLAYSILAGMDGNEQISENTTLRDLARNNRSITISGNSPSNASKILLASSMLFADEPESQNLTINNINISLDSLAKLILAEQMNSQAQEGCMQIHAIEALCICASNLKKAECLHKHVENQLYKKLDELYLFGRALEMFYLPNTQTPDAIHIPPNFTDSFGSSISHLLELGALAMYCGFELSVSHINAMHFILNISSRLFEEELIKSSVFDLSFSHFRRGASILIALDEKRRGNLNDPQIDLSSYSARLGSRRNIA